MIHAWQDYLSSSIHPLNKVVQRTHICLGQTCLFGGIQFTFDGGTSGLALTGAAGGLAGDAGFSVSTSGNGTVLGFSFTGAQIPASSGQVLTSVTGTFTDGSLTTVGPVMGGSDAFSTPTAQLH